MAKRQRDRHYVRKPGVVRWQNVGCRSALETKHSGNSLIILTLSSQEQKGALPFDDNQPVGAK